MEALIYPAILVLWLAYLIPMFLRRQKVAAQAPIEPMESGVRMVRRPVVTETDDSELSAEVSTPLTRRAGLHNLRRSEENAARRRRNVLTALMFATTVVLVLCLTQVVPWWSLAIPGGLVVIFFVTARISVVFLRRDLDARRDELLGFGVGEEQTIAVSVDELRRGAAIEGVALGVPEDEGGQLWQPLPIASPTYVSRPVNGRSIRTIDLSTPASAPAATDAQDRPVTADEPTEAIPRSGSTVVNPAELDRTERPRAVGE